MHKGQKYRWMCMALLFALIAIAQTKAQNWGQESIRQQLQWRVLDPIEGLWEFPNDGAQIFITKTSNTTFDIYLIDSPRLDAPPGILIGNAVATPTQGRYDARLDHKGISSAKSHKKNTILNVNDATLTLKPYSKGFSVSFRRWVPYFLRMSITEKKEPEGLKGAKRIYPIDKDNYKPCL